MNRLQWAILCTGAGMTLLMAASLGATMEMTCSDPPGSCDEAMADFIVDFVLVVFASAIGSISLATGIILFILEIATHRSGLQDDG